MQRKQLIETQAAKEHFMKGGEVQRIEYGSENGAYWYTTDEWKENTHFRIKPEGVNFERVGGGY